MQCAYNKQDCSGVQRTLDYLVYAFWKQTGKVMLMGWSKVFGNSFPISPELVTEDAPSPLCCPSQVLVELCLIVSSMEDI